MMKKSRPILSFLLILALIFAWNPCVLAVDSSDTGTGKILVAYYSATGNTERVASYIKETLNADTFEITPANPYSSDDLRWTNPDSRVNHEHDNPELRDIELVTSKVDNWDSYDVVFIGYPIWWGIAAWPVNHFITDNDFTGKTVIPFCTSSSSGLGQSGQLLAEMAGTGDWQEGHRFGSSVSESTVQNWVETLTLPTPPTSSQPVIDAPDILENACTVDTVTGTVTMTIPDNLLVGLSAIKNVFCAFDNVAYQAGFVSTDNPEIAFTPKDRNYQTVKIFTLDENYRPVCKSTVITVQVPASG